VRAIAIDGPAAAGKSTIGRALARALGWRYVDTGAMYRAVALAALERGVTPRDGDVLGSLASLVEVAGDGQTVSLNGRDVTARIRGADVTRLASEVAAVPEVRQALVARQRALASSGGVVMEGRDIGTVVLPEAKLKVWLTASVEERARRRGDDLGLEQDEAARAEVERAIAARDEADASREASPLARAGDAVVIDSTDKSVDEVVGAILAAAPGDVRAGS
jgi:CMP/dCMP kinase